MYQKNVKGTSPSKATLGSTSKGFEEASQGHLGSTTRGAQDASRGSLGTPTRGGAHDFACPASGEMSKVGSTADGKGRGESLGHESNKPAASDATTNMKRVADVADGRR
jgi:hypothetical protein